VYSSVDEVKTWAQYTDGDLGASGLGENESITNLINSADRAIEDYTDQPAAYFEPGGVNIQEEYGDSVDVGDYGLLVSFGLSIRRRPFWRFKYSPVLSITKLEKSDSGGSWSTLTEGRGSDYLVMENGVRFLRNLPTLDYKNLRVTYMAGYTTTPGRVSECSARLAASMIHRIIDSKTRNNTATGGPSVDIATEFVGLSKACFTKDMKELVRRYRRKVPVTLL